MEHSSSAEVCVLECEVQFRSYVLGYKNLDVAFLLVLIGKKGSPVCKFHVWSLCVVVRQIFRSVAPALVRSEERRVLICLSLEIVVWFDRRTGNSKP